jgi:hypothetical protein
MLLLHWIILLSYSFLAVSIPIIIDASMLLLYWKLCLLSLTLSKLHSAEKIWKTATVAARWSNIQQEMQSVSQSGDTNNKRREVWERESCGVLHIFLCTSTCFSLHLYSCRIFFFSASTIYNFSMMNSCSTQPSSKCASFSIKSNHFATKMLSRSVCSHSLEMSTVEGTKNFA